MFVNCADCEYGVCVRGVVFCGSSVDSRGVPNALEESPYGGCDYGVRSSGTVTVRDGVYLFPEIVSPSRKNLCRTVRERAEKVVEEACEVFDEAKRSGTSAFDRDAYLLELLDTVHAVETALRRDFTVAEVVAGVNRVVEKNRVRGFYDPPVE